MRAIIAATLALAAAAAPAAAQSVLHQWPAGATTITYPPNCPVTVAGAYAAMTGGPFGQVVVQARNGDASRAREVVMQIVYVGNNGNTRREGNAGPFRIAAGQVQEMRTINLPPGVPAGSTLTIRVTGCSQA